MDGLLCPCKNHDSVRPKGEKSIPACSYYCVRFSGTKNVSIVDYKCLLSNCNKTVIRDNVLFTNTKLHQILNWKLPIGNICEAKLWMQITRRCKGGLAISCDCSTDIIFLKILYLLNKPRNLLPSCSSSASTLDNLKGFDFVAERESDVIGLGTIPKFGDDHNLKLSCELAR